MALKKIVSGGLMGLCSVAIALSCKHEVAELSPPGGTGTGGTNQPLPACNPDTVYFQQQVLPIFISNCSLSSCHNAVSHQDGVVLTNYTSIISTGDIKAGDPDDSEVYEKITEHDDDDRMPPRPRNRLPQQQIDLIYKWIMQGARNNSCVSAVCDTPAVTFNASIKPIIASKCQGCHSSSAPQGGIDYSTYAGIKAKVNDGRLWGAINHIPGFSPMPKNGNKLSDCEIATFKIWINAGAPNN